MSLRGTFDASAAALASNASAALAQRGLSGPADAAVNEVVLDLFIESPTAIAIAWVTAFVSVVLTAHLVYKHLQYYNLPLLQRQIIRIVLMVPIYGVTSAWSLTHPHWSVYLATVRDCWEAFVIHCFLVRGCAFPPGVRASLSRQAQRACSAGAAESGVRSDARQWPAGASRLMLSPLPCASSRHRSARVRSRT